MQFVANGPDIPDALLEAHEEGRVVFFCGAGISYPAGLPGFKGLVDAIYRNVGTTPDAIEQEAYRRHQFDATLDLLQRRVPGQRLAVRKALAEALQPKLRRKGATETHSALLLLARSRDGALRLVTTNFDRIFARIVAKTKQVVASYPAPLLPIPKSSRWNGLVYLHGLLPEKIEESELNRLVLTSGDFGLAYLTERWAARFVSELFRNYVVCFVGYSINDPVLRYMMDAIAADRMLGEVTPQAYALGDCEPGQESKKTIEWEAKGVVPILYEVPAGSHDHAALHRTLKVWSETYRDGIVGKERIVVDYALGRPSASTQQDNFVGRMLWALSHRSGLPAKRFADFDPVPALDWLDAFSENRYQHGDLVRFGVPPQSEADKKLRFSLIRRPAPYSHSPWMMLAFGGARGSEWDDVMFHIARWLARHLDDPNLILWIAQHGGQLHDRFVWSIEERLRTYAQLERENKSEELARIRAQAPNAIPRPQLRIIWRLLLTGRVKSNWRELDLYRWKERLKRDGLSATLRFELREILAPKVAIKKPFQWNDESPKGTPAERLKQLISWELVLGADHVHSSMRDLSENEHWQGILPLLFEDLQQQLRDALDLLCELGEADGRNDRSHWDLPSISPHWQNRGYRDWVSLIELLRDAWQAIRKIDSNRATRIALSWFEMPYSSFKRLAIFAASQEDCIDPDLWIEWLVSEDAWWLWSIDTKREVLRLLVLQGQYATPKARTKLEAAILRGPPRKMYRKDVKRKHWQEIVDHLTWLYLSKFKLSGAQLGKRATVRLGVLSIENPFWKLAKNERDEFSHWMSGTGDPDFEDSRNVDIAPRKRVELVAWLKRPQPAQRAFHEDTWTEVCRNRFFHSAFALSDLALEEKWPIERWRLALQVWSEEGRIIRSWRYLALVVNAMPNQVLTELVHSVSWWLEAVSKSIDRHEDLFLKLCRQILEMPHQDSEDNEKPVTHAINHPIGHITQALLNMWLRRKPNDNDLLPANVEPFFTDLCDVSKVQYRSGRVLLASRLITLFRVDRPWTESHVLPLLNWSTNAVEARAAWEGFLWSPRLYRDLLIAAKPQFLESANHYSELGEHAQQFAAFLTYAALAPVDGYTSHDFQIALGVLPQDGLQASAQALVQALEGAGEQREEYWCNRIYGFWHDIWPKTRLQASSNIAECLARLCIAARGQFPAALAAVLNWLQPIEHPDYVVHLLQESGLSGRFPETALRLLDALIDDQPWAPREIGQCLIDISTVAPQLLDDHRYRRLTEYFRRRGLQ